MAAGGGHGLCVASKAEPLDLRDACRTVGPEDQAKEMGDDVIELPACARVGEFGAVRASRDVALPAARTRRAPGSLHVLVTALASAAQVGFACTAVEPAMGHQLSFHRDRLIVHRRLHFSG